MPWIFQLLFIIPTLFMIYLFIIYYSYSLLSPNCILKQQKSEENVYILADLLQKNKGVELLGNWFRPIICNAVSPHEQATWLSEMHIVH